MTARASFPRYLGLLCVLLACGAPPSSPAPPSRAPAPVEPSYRGFPVTMPPLVSPELGPVFESAARSLDPRQMYFALEQQPPAGFVPIPKRAAPFPGRSFARARAYRFAGDRLYPQRAILDSTKAGCGASIIAGDGSFCPSVERPSLPLSPEQVSALVEVVNRPNEVPRVVMNGFHFVFGVVFFDDADVPLAEVMIDRDVTKLLLRPAPSEEAIDTMAPARRDSLRALLHDLGLRPASSEELAKVWAQQRERDGDLHEARFIPTESGVDPALRLDRATTREQARLCAWQQQVYRRGLPRSTEPNGIECEDGRRMTGTDFAGCLQRFPSCSATVGSVEACMRRQRFDPCLLRPVAHECRELVSCFWGFDP